jgi:hypothetical protein
MEIKNKIRNENSSKKRRKKGKAAWFEADL